jgi:lysophospholipase L1-like esterase
MVAVSLLAAGCGSSPVSPVPPPGAPTIACPANVTIAGVNGATQVVSYPPPTAAGGVAPLNIVCTPPSGSPFPLGTTPVACSVTDAIGRLAQCAFSATLSAPVLSVSKFMAFGDSFTEGENGQASIADIAIIDEPNSYPVKLQAHFDTDYPGQHILVSSHGKGGEAVGDGESRLAGFIAAERPGAVLLLEGYNDLSACPPSPAIGAACAAAIAGVVSGLRDDIRIALAPASGVRFVFVSTLTPPGPFRGGRDRRLSGDAIVQVNAQIAPMVKAERATLVDPYPLFLGHETDYVGDDGLHLRPAGYQVLADQFFAAIRATIPPLPGLTLGRRR